MTERVRDNDKRAWIESLIRDFFDSPENSLGNGDRAFDEPLVGFAPGDDSIFQAMKEDIGVFYMTPLEAFEKVYPASGVKAQDLCVISWVMPHIKKTKIDNRREKSLPSERWARGKKSGVLISMKLQKHLTEKLADAGFRAMAPCAPPHWSQQVSEKYGLCSTWSERHAAYAAGLGTFGLCDGLITPVGKAMRCGSLVVEIPVPPVKRPYEKHTEYCLYLTRGTCGVCMKRCPVGAISPDGHDKKKCAAHVDGICVEHTKAQYGLDINVCGLCQTKVPCESGIPGRTGKRG